jgi:hypothetical protein
MARLLCQCSKCRMVYFIAAVEAPKCLDCGSWDGQRVLGHFDGEVI